MTTRKQDRDLANAQAATTDDEAFLPADERAKEVPEAAEAEKQERQPGIYVELKGEEFRLSEETGYMALMEWAAASDGAGSAGAAATRNLRAMYHILEDIIADADEFDRFRAHARATKAGYTDFLDFQNSAYEALTGNPTE